MTDGAPPPRPLEVLVVDDAAPVRSRLAALVAEVPGLAPAVLAGSVAEARTLLAGSHPGIALVDLRLPDGSGLDVLRDIREKAPAARVVILTACDAAGVGPSCLAAGADAFFSKTSGLDGLPALLASIVNRSHGPA